MKLSEWLHRNSLHPNKAAEKFVDVEVLYEVSCTSMSHEKFMAKLATGPKFKTQYINSYVVLKNGYAVGFNENPSQGYTTPIVKFKEEKSPE